jgi:hypothetical protein
MTFMPSELPQLPRLATYLWPSKYLWQRVIHGFLLGAITTLITLHRLSGTRALAHRIALSFGAIFSVYLFLAHFAPLLYYVRVAPENLRFQRAVGAALHVPLYQNDFKWAFLLFISGSILSLKRRHLNKNVLQQENVL